MTSNVPPVVFDYEKLNREYAKTQIRLFQLEKNAMFFGSLASNLEFAWDESMPTAATNGIYLWWSPAFFEKCSIKLRMLVQVHELWHVARMHMLRIGNRDPRVWNIACDFVINNSMDDDGFDFKEFQTINFKPCLDHQYDGMVEEQIYELLIQEEEEILSQMDIFEDLIVPAEPGQQLPADMYSKVLSAVIKANQAAVMQGEETPEAVTTVLKQFLKPKVPWERYLYKFFDALIETYRSYKRPNRRYSHMYLPVEDANEGLEDLFYFVDVSGSITDMYIVRFNSEIKHIKEKYKPKRLTVIQFDHAIEDVKIFTEDDPFEEIIVVGRGGTDLRPVHDYIEEHQPDAAVIFTDLECTAMEPVSSPVVWVVVNNPSIKPAFGDIINIRE